MKGERKLFLLESNGENFVPVKVEEMPGKFDLIELYQLILKNHLLTPLNKPSLNKLKNLINQM